MPPCIPCLTTIHIDYIDTVVTIDYIDRLATTDHHRLVTIAGLYRHGSHYRPIDRLVSIVYIDSLVTRAVQVFPTTMYFRTQYFLEEQQDSINYYTIMKTYDYNLHI